MSSPPAQARRRRAQAPLPPQASDGADLPHRLRRSPLRAAGLGFLFAYSAFGATTILLGVMRTAGARAPDGAGLAVLLAVVALAAAGVVVSLLRPIGVLFVDRIETPGVLRTRVLHRANVAAVRQVGLLPGRRRVLLKSGAHAEASVELPLWVLRDRVAAAWLEPTPDPAWRTPAFEPDADLRAADYERLLARPRFTAGAQDLDRALARARLAGWALGLAGLAVALWLTMRPLDAASLVIAAMSLLAGAGLSVALEGLLAWFPVSRARGSAIGSAMPFALVAVRAAAEIRLVHPLGFGVLGLVAAVGAGAATWMRRPRPPAQRLAIALAAGCLGGLLAYGALTAADAGLDGGAATPSPAAGTGPCPEAHPGALGAPWRGGGACEARP